MITEYINLLTLNVIEYAMTIEDGKLVQALINDALRDYEKKILFKLLGIGYQQTSLENIAQETGHTYEQTYRQLTRLLLKIRKDPLAKEVWDLADEEVMAIFADGELDRKWNIAENSDLYYMHGGFYVNRNPYCEDSEAPKKGIPFDHSNRIMLMNMSDFHSTAIVLGQGDKRGLFVFESAWGMQGFRYLGIDRELFPNDEIRFCDATDDSGIHVGYFACRNGQQWSIVRVGDGDAPYNVETIVPFEEQSFEEAISKLGQYEANNDAKEWIKA